VPTSHGKRLVVRVLDKSARLYPLEEVGMARETYERFRELSLEHGLVFVTGPTGGGKTDRPLRGAQEINQTERNRSLYPA